MAAAAAAAEATAAASGKQRPPRLSRSARATLQRPPTQARALPASQPASQLARRRPARSELAAAAAAAAAACSRTASAGRAARQPGECRRASAEAAAAAAAGLGEAAQRGCTSAPLVAPPPLPKQGQQRAHARTPAAGAARVTDAHTHAPIRWGRPARAPISAPATPNSPSATQAARLFTLAALAASLAWRCLAGWPVGAASGRSTGAEHARSHARPLPAGRARGRQV